MDRAPLSPGEAKALEDWLAHDPRARGAFVRCQAMWQLLDQPASAAAGPAAPLENPERLLGRRDLLAAGGLAGVAAAASLLLLPRTHSPVPAPSRFSTTRQQIRTLALQDGSTSTLDADSVFEFRFDSLQRLVTLERGRGWFDVAPDKARPFVVTAGAVVATALGTSFSVAQLGSVVTVTVLKGLVSVASRHGAIQVGPRMLVQIARDGGILTQMLSDPELDRLLAWRDRRIVLMGDMVGDAIKRFNQFNDVQIVIANSTIAREPLVGSFDIYRPDAFVDALTKALPIVAIRSPGIIRLETAG